MNRLESIGAVTYAIGWVSIVVGVIFRVCLYSARGAHFATAINVSPRNLVQLSLLAFVIAIASDTRCSVRSVRSD